MGPKLGGGGVSRGLAKSPGFTFFWKPFLSATTVSIKPHVKANYRRHVRNKHSNYKAPTNTQIWS